MSRLFDRNYSNLEKGRALSSVEAEELEQRLRKRPVNVSARIKLIGYYPWWKPEGIPRTPHVLWLIANRPELTVWRHYLHMSLGRHASPDARQKAEELWLAQIDSHPGNSDVLGNAGIFLLESEINCDAGKKFLIQAIELTPAEDYWANYLGMYCYWQAQVGDKDLREQNFEDALKYGDIFLKRISVVEGVHASPVHLRGIIMCACAAMLLGKLDLAEMYANEAKQFNDMAYIKFKDARSLLGLIALRRGDVERAEQYLLESNDSHEPDRADLELANELLQLGRTDSVLAYLKLCKKYKRWKDRDLKQWSDDIRQQRDVVIR